MNLSYFYKDKSQKIIFNYLMLFFVFILNVVLSYIKIKKLELWGFELKSRVIIIALVVILLIFSYLLEMQKSNSLFRNTIIFSLVVIIPQLLILLPEKHFIFNPILLPVVIAGMYLNKLSGYIINIYICILMYFTEYCITEKILFCLAFGCIILFLIEFCGQNGIKQIYSFSILFINCIVLNVIFQYMINENIKINQIAYSIITLIITLLPVQLVIIYERINKLKANIQANEILKEEYFLLEKLMEEDTQVYYHSLEVADMAARVAKQLKANVSIVNASARLHEIGRLINPNYVDAGVKLLKQYKINSAIINIVKEHNSKENLPSTYEAVIVMLSDTIVTTLNHLSAKRLLSSEDKIKIIKNIFEIRLESGILSKVVFTTDEYIKLQNAFIQIQKS